MRFESMASEEKTIGTVTVSRRVDEIAVAAGATPREHAVLEQGFFVEASASASSASAAFN